MVVSTTTNNLFLTKTKILIDRIVDNSSVKNKEFENQKLKEKL